MEEDISSYSSSHVSMIERTYSPAWSLALRPPGLTPLQEPKRQVPLELQVPEGPPSSSQPATHRVARYKDLLSVGILVLQTLVVQVEGCHFRSLNYSSSIDHHIFLNYTLEKTLIIEAQIFTNSQHLTRMVCTLRYFKIAWLETPPPFLIKYDKITIQNCKEL